jgi:DHA1 family inner membrane transport protein
MFTLYTYISRCCIPSPTPSAVCDRDAGADWRRLFAGQLSGGKFADRSVSGTLKGFLLLLMVIMLAIPLLAQSQVGAAISMVVWGAATFAVVPPLQMRVMRVAHEAPGLSSSVNIGAFNLGNALGAAAGGAVISGGLGYAFVPVMGAIIAGVALLLVLFSGRAQPEEAFANR